MSVKLEVKDNMGVIANIKLQANHQHIATAVLKISIVDMYYKKSVDGGITTRTYVTT